MKNITLSKLGFKLGRLLSIIYLCFTPFNCLSTSYPVSQSDALRIAMAQFPNEAYDYYLVHNDFQSSWTIFVDAYPTASWDHECYTVIIPKTSSTPSLLINPGIISQRTPPSCPITPLVLQEDTSPQRMPIRIQRTDSINNNSELASKTYAIIISGGLNKEYNEYHAIGINQDGEMSSDSVLVPPTIGIKSIHISDNLLNVYFYSIPANGSSLEIINLSNQSNALNIDLNDLSSNLEIDISSLCSGVYAIAYLSNGITIDSKTFIKP